MKELNINDKLWHPLSLDIIEHKVISKTEFEDRTVYIAKAVNGVGASGRVEVELSIDRKGVVRFIGLADDYEYDSGLQDFVEGIYYRTRSEARAEYYKIQKTLAWGNMEEKRRLLKDAEKSYATCCRILKELAEEKKENDIRKNT